MNINDVIKNLKLYPLAVISFVVVLVCLVLNFLRGDLVTSLETTESELYSRIRVIEKNKVNASGLKSDLENLQAQVDTIDERLFDRYETAVNTNFFYALENEAELVIKSVSQSAREDTTYSKGGVLELGTYSALSYEFIFEAKYREFLKLLYKLHVADPLMRVVDYGITAGASPDLSEVHNVRIRLVVLAKKN